MACGTILNVTPRDTTLNHTKQGKQHGHQPHNWGRMENSRANASNLEAYNNIRGSFYHQADRTRSIAYNSYQANNKLT